MFKNMFRRSAASSSSEPMLPITIENSTIKLSKERITSGLTASVLLGESTFASVWKADWIRDEGTLEIAIKMFREDREIEFEDECELGKYITSKGTHPHVIRCYGKISHPEEFWLALEYIDGDNMKEWLRNNDRTNPKTLQQSYKIVLDLFKALIFLHSIRVVHLDVKPSNLMIASNGHAKLIDFNTSKVMPQDEDVLFLRRHLGTTRYYSPEMCEKIDGLHEVSFSTDIYSAMLTLLIAVSKNGCDVYANISRKNKQELIRKVLAQEYPEFPESIPAETKALILHGLKYDKKERPTAQQAHDLLETVIEDQNFLRQRVLNVLCCARERLSPSTQQ